MPQPYLLIPPTGSSQSEEWVRLGVDAQMQAQQETDPGRRAGRFADAERNYRQALRLEPHHAVATQNLAVLYAQLGNLNEGLLAAERAALFDGAMPLIHMNRAFMCLEADRIDEAMKAGEKAVGLAKERKKPEDDHGYLGSRLALAMVYATAGHADRTLPLYDEMLAVQPDHPVAGPNACFVTTLTDATTLEMQTVRKRWRAAQPQFPVQPYPNVKDTERKLRVGYVGGDFKRHSAAMIFANVILNHSDDVEVYLYSSLPVDPNSDPVTKLFQAKAGKGWRDISAKNDDDAAAMVRADRIDVLVDLAGHTGGGRLPLFLRKSAPVQCCGWGFAHGTGCPEFDAFLADPVAVPESERSLFAEKAIIDLPCLVTYLEPEYGLKASSPLPYYQNDCITFGSYARYEKLSDQCLKTFAEIMRRLPEARMQFKDHAFRRPYAIQRVRNLMEGVDSSRLLFSISTTHPEHMLAYQQCDLALDPFPHGGGIVSLEQLYMGVPVLTLYGKHTGGRNTASVLTAMGRGSLIAQDLDQYINKAVSLAGDVKTLAAARKTLRKELLESPVVKGYAGKVEEAYRSLWTEWCKR